MESDVKMLGRLQHCFGGLPIVILVRSSIAPALINCITVYISSHKLILKRATRLLFLPTCSEAKLMDSNEKFNNQISLSLLFPAILFINIMPRPSQLLLSHLSLKTRQNGPGSDSLRICGIPFTFSNSRLHVCGYHFDASLRYEADRDAKVFRYAIDFQVSQSRLIGNDVEELKAAMRGWRGWAWIERLKRWRRRY